MCGKDESSGSLFSYVDLEARVPRGHPLRAIRDLTNAALVEMSGEFEALYSRTGRPGIAPEKLLRALLLQALYSIRSERQLMEQLEFNLLFRWFVGLGIDDRVWDATVFTKNRERLLAGAVASRFLAHLISLPAVKHLLSQEHFPVDGTQIEVVRSRLWYGGAEMASRADKESFQSLLAAVSPYLEAERRLERELDRYLAPKFNPFDYLRTNELALSRTIAGLLDPASAHGQGASFLSTMLDVFPLTQGRFARLVSTTAKPVVVRTERTTDTGGRIDITVDIPEDENTFCLAFENKPYAAQEKDQVTAYLKYLRKRYQQHFLLVYLPPSGEGPSCEDLPPSDREHFEVMPYVGENSLADWFAACRKRCDAWRVKVFLRDAEQFCRKEFGDTAMTTDRTTQAAKEYLLDNPPHLPAALALRDAWPLLRDEVCKRFLKRLRNEVEHRIRREPEYADCRVCCRYKGNKTYSNILIIFREAWAQYDDCNEDFHSEGRTTIRLENSHKGCNGWIWGVWSPKDVSEMDESERERRERLYKGLNDRGLQFDPNPHYAVQYEALECYGDWDPLVLDLHHENDRGGGPITTYFTEGLLDIAAKAIPAIDAVEGQNPQ